MSASVKKKTSSKSGRAGQSRSRSSHTAVKKTAGRKSASVKRRSAGRKSASAKGRTSTGRAASARRTSSGTRARAAAERPASSAGAKKRVSTSAGKAPELNPVWVDIILLMVLGLTAVLLIGNIGRAGFVGNRMSSVCFGLFGVMEYVFPFLFLMGSFFYAANRFNRLIARKMTGLILIFLFLCAAMQLFGYGFVRGQSAASYFETSLSGHTGGGLLGGLIVMLFGTAFGVIGAKVLTIIGLFIGVLMLTQRPILHVISQKSRMAAQKRRIRRDVRREEARREEARREMDFESLKEQVRKEEAQKLARERKTRVPQSLAEAPEVKEPSASVASIPGADGRPELDMPRFGAKPVTAEDRKYEAAAKSGLKTESRPAEITDIRTGKALPQEKKTLPEGGFGLPSFLRVREAVSAAGSALRQKGEPSGYRMDPVTGEILGDASDDPSSETEDKAEKAAAGPAEAAQTAGRKAASLAKKPVNETKTGSGSGPASPETTGQDEIRKAEAAGRAAQAGTKAAEKPVSEKQETKVAEKPVSGKQGNMAGTASEARPGRAGGKLPPFDLLTPGERIGAGNTREYAQKMENLLVEKLAEFGVEVTPTKNEEYSVGPTVTRYELTPGTGVKVSRIVNLQDDIKLALKAKEIRIEAPIPGKAAVGIEVPNDEPQTVALRDLLESKEFRTSRARLAFAVGKNIEGKPVIADIEKMPHLLIAGATGSGKSVCINTLIMSLLYKYTPEEVRLLLIDPKVVELKIYDGIPHLLIPVVTDAKKAAGALNWAVQEMTGRYNTFAKYTGVRDIRSYNKKVEELTKAGETDESLKKMPRIVIIVDELADLMMVASQDVEDAICRLAQLARAAGIHLVVATQRPSVNVVTGQIKANMPSRIALAVTSGVDSRTILDMNGAEKLLGKGDMLYYPQGHTKPERVQGAYVSDSDIARVVDFLTAQSEEVAYNKEVEESIATSVNAMTNGASLSDDGNNGRDEYFAESGRLIIQKEKASIGMLQRAFKIGFNRAARIMDQLCDAGVVGGEEGTKPRKILMTSEQFEQMLSSE